MMSNLNVDGLKMKLAIAQINCVLGDLEGNSAKILHYMERAKSQGAQLLLTPELSLCGYPPEDLLLRDGFYKTCAEALSVLAGNIRELRWWWVIRMSKMVNATTRPRCCAMAK